MSTTKNNSQDVGMKEITNALCSMVSSDETRWHLTGINMNKDLQMAVATDGHRMFGASHLYNPEHANKTCKAKPFKDDLDFVDMKVERYPNVLQFIPAPLAWKNCIELTIPPFFASFKKLPKGVKNIIIELNTAGAYPFFAVTHVSHKVAEAAKRICFNAHYLAELAGWDVIIRWNDDVSPMLITPKLDDPKKCDWFMVLMPMRGGDLPSISIPSAFLNPKIEVETKIEIKTEEVISDNVAAEKIEQPTTQPVVKKATGLKFKKGMKWTEKSYTQNSEVTV